MVILPLPLDRVEEIFALYDSFNRPPDLHLSKPQATETLNRIREQRGPRVPVHVFGGFRVRSGRGTRS